jgi:ParB family transcriptional regulator, chromosome partitioning protein
VCSNPACPVHHPQKQINRDDDKWKAEQEKRRREEAIANATGLRVLAAIQRSRPGAADETRFAFIAERWNHRWTRIVLPSSLGNMAS